MPANKVEAKSVDDYISSYVTGEITKPYDAKGKTKLIKKLNNNVTVKSNECVNILLAKLGVSEHERTTAVKYRATVYQ
ncbi:hypothetical protein BX070DRAFT_230044 [Coemansia spiralis]|nr:hypothetical protein BX070DRAFT_230044 [Coemansia spiralis]